MASRNLSSVCKRPTRTYPSPCSPNPTPGATATCAFSSKISANCSDVYPFGTGSHAKNHPVGISTFQPIE